MPGSQISSFNFKYNNKEKFELLESFNIGEENILFLSESFKYWLLNCRGEMIHSSKLDLNHPCDQIPMLEKNCQFFTPTEKPYEIIAVKFLKPIKSNLADLVYINLATGEITGVFATEIEIPDAKNQFRKFCWLKYDVERKTVQFAFAIDKNKVNYHKGLEKGSHNPLAEVISFGEKDCDSEKLVGALYNEFGNTLMIANNTDKTKIEMTYLHPDGHRNFTFKFNEGRVMTIQTFGFLNEGFFYWIAIEGKGGKSTMNKFAKETVCAFLMNVNEVGGMKNVKDIEEKNLKCVFLDDGLTNGIKDDPDGNIMINRNTNMISCTTNTNKVIDWMFFANKHGQWDVTRDATIGGRSELCNYCCSRDNNMLWAWDYSEGNEYIMFDVHGKFTMKIMYYWFLEHLLGVDNWNSIEINRMSELLI